MTSELSFAFLGYDLDLIDSVPRLHVCMFVFVVSALPLLRYFVCRFLFPLSRLVFLSGPDSLLGDLFFSRLIVTLLLAPRLLGAASVGVVSAVRWYIPRSDWTFCIWHLHIPSTILIFRTTWKHGIMFSLLTNYETFSKNMFISSKF